VSEAPTIDRDSAARRTAKVVTDVLSPVVLATIQLFVVPSHQVGLLRGLGWGLLAVAFVSAAPLAYILIRVRRRTLTDVHIGVREHRRLPFLVGLGTVVLGLVVLAASGAPRDLLVLVGTFVVLTVAVITVTSWWKISVHAMVATMTVGVLVALYGSAALTGVAGIAVIGWARVRLGDHTVGQVVVGVLAGVAIAGVFVLAR
jgi:membrane-associated phospholipid phosphatase